MVGQPAEQSPKHAAGECHQAAQPQQIAQQRGHKGHAHPVVRAQQHGAQDVDHVLYRGALAAKDGKAEHAAHHGKRAEHSRQSRVFSLRDFHEDASFAKYGKTKTGDACYGVSCKNPYLQSMHFDVMTSYGGIIRIRLKGRSSGTSSQPALQAPCICVDAHILHPSAPNCKSRFAIQFPSGMLY